MTQPVLKVDNISVDLGRPATRILRSLSLEIHPGEVVALIGETGSGKSTLAKSVLGLTAVSEGTIQVEDVRVQDLSSRGRRRFWRSGKAQYVFQDPLRSLDPDFTIGRSIVEGLRYTAPAAERRRTLEYVAERVGLSEELVGRRPHELSGGQRQRAAIARALAVRPRLLLCDEPVSALDASSRSSILKLLRKVTTEESVGTLLITHDLGSLPVIADKIAVLHRGEIVEFGQTDTVLTAPQHPYTRLLRASIPRLYGEQLSADVRGELRAAVEATPEKV